MANSTSSSYVQAVRQLIPQEYASQIDELPDKTVSLLDAVIRFVSGGECPTGVGDDIRGQWTKQQGLVGDVLESLKKAPAPVAVTGATRNHKGPNSGNLKRGREEDSDEQPGTKKARSDTSEPAAGVAENNEPLYTLHALSVSSPIRKKVDITIYKTCIRFTNPTTNATELSVPLSHLKRGFLVPTKGKTKPHWTIVLMSLDTPLPTGRGSASVPASVKEDQPQIIFGVDATPPPFSITDYTKSSPGEPTSHPKGTAILPYLKEFLAHLPFRTLEPSTAVFRSALSTGEGSSGVEGYRGAKSGTLWFFSEGILWDGKPCEFWSFTDLAVGRRNGKGQPDVDLGGAEGVRTVSATGRTCSVILRRRLPKPTAEGQNGERADGEEGEKGEEEEEENGVDTDIGMVDGKEQEVIARWVKKHRHLFGIVPDVNEAGPSSGKGKEKQVTAAGEDEEDEEDSDFEDDSSSDGGSPTEASSEGGSDAGGGGGGSDDEDAGSEDVGSGSNSEQSEDEEEAEGEGEAEGEDVVEELDPKHHPLLRPGAMPRMSRAAMDAVVDMVVDDLLPKSGQATAGGDSGESGDEEEDELED